jgi:hypothetical protein
MFFQFDASAVEPQKALDNSPIPAGTYTAHVIESAVKPLKSGNGNGMFLTFEILEGPSAKRRVWTTLNVQHSNPDTQSIAQKQLSALCHAVHVIRMTDTSQLHNKPLKIRVTIKKDEQYGDRNEVKGYEPIGSAGVMPMPGATIPTPPAANTAPAAAPGAKTAPWASGKAA